MKESAQSSQTSALTALRKARLYGILDLGYLSEEELIPAAQQLAAGGVDLLQLRAKGHDQGQVLQWALRLAPVCRELALPFIVNDYPEIAAKVGADGLHLGQEDGSWLWARDLVGPEMILGRSTHSPAQARQALQDGFDYIGFGPLYVTPTKKGRPAIGLADLRTVQESLGSDFPVFGIGGVSRQTLPAVLTAGAQRVVIVSDLLRSTDRAAAAREAKTILSEI